jgi:hypothetical protein
MRKLFGVLAAGLLALGVAGQAQAAALPFSGVLGVQIATLPPVVITGSGISTVNGSGGAGHLTSLDIPASPFAVAGVVVPVTDPAAFPIVGVQVTAHNGPGDFGGGSAVGTLGGTMSIQGVAKVCLFAPCNAPPPANVNVPLSNVGVGGSATVSFLVNLTVVGAPWTTGTAAVATITQMGFAHGPASGTTSTAAASGVVRLVTPVFVSTNIGASAVLPVFGVLTLHFVPEPGTLVLLGSGIAGLVAFGRSRRS